MMSLAALLAVLAFACYTASKLDDLLAGEDVDIVLWLAVLFFVACVCVSVVNA